MPPQLLYWTLKCSALEDHSCWSAVPENRVGGRHVVAFVKHKHWALCTRSVYHRRLPWTVHYISVKAEYSLCKLHWCFYHYDTDTPLHCTAYSSFLTAGWRITCIQVQEWNFHCQLLATIIWPFNAASPEDTFSLHSKVSKISSTYVKMCITAQPRHKTRVGQRGRNSQWCNLAELSLIYYTVWWRAMKTMPTH